MIWVSGKQYFDEEDDMFEEYERYVISNPGIPDDYETWLQNQPINHKRKKKLKPRKFTEYDY